MPANGSSARTGSTSTNSSDRRHLASPQDHYGPRTTIVTDTRLLMAHIIIQHQVADFDAWRPIYEADRPGRQAAGVTDVAVLRDADDPNSVWLIHEGDPALVGTMMSDPERAGEDAGSGRHQPTHGLRGRSSRADPGASPSRRESVPGRHSSARFVLGPIGTGSPPSQPATSGAPKANGGLAIAPAEQSVRRLRHWSVVAGLTSAPIARSPPIWLARRRRS